MSDRQIAYAATSGRKVTFTVVHQEQPIVGYVVGSDDYHWLVADPSGEGDVVTTSLVHKGLAPVATISPVSTLENEPPAVRAAVEGIGRGFWLFCDREYFGKKQGQDISESPAAPHLAACAEPVALDRRHPVTQPRQEQTA